MAARAVYARTGDSLYAAVVTYVAQSGRLGYQFHPADLTVVQQPC